MHDPLIQCRGICKDYAMGGEVIHALRDVSLSVNRGEYVAVMGPSGLVLIGTALHYHSIII